MACCNNNGVGLFGGNGTKCDWLWIVIIAIIVLFLFGGCCD